MKKVKVVQTKEQEIPTEIIAQAIVDIAEGMKKINESRLTREALIILISAKSGVARGTIKIVLNNLDLLERNFLKKKLPQGN